MITSPMYFSIVPPWPLQDGFIAEKYSVSTSARPRCPAGRQLRRALQIAEDDRDGLADLWRGSQSDEN
jgi:hypothetical protein